MTSPLPLPDWVPWWVHVAILLALLLLGLLYILMPFSVFGLKARLEAVDARLDEIQGEIRSLSLRLPEPSLAEDEDLHAPPRARLRPPIPPAPLNPGRTPPAPRGRTEPRLY
ncbi:MAG: hypothetical protein JOZ05_01960 [Acetobacteraceae bacterium]|nr:hypothetical protein [Acetobacteraceae bacterium]